MNGDDARGYPRSRSLLIAFSLFICAAPSTLLAQTAVMYYVPGLFYQSYASDSDFSKSFDFTVARQGQGDIDFFVTVDGGLLNSYEPRYAASGSNRIAYYIYDNLTDRNVLKSGTGVSAPNVISGGFTNPSSWYESATVGYSIFVPSGQFLPLGEYRDTLTFTLYTGTPDHYAPGSGVSMTVPVVLATERYLGVKLAPLGGSYNSGTSSYAVDFGRLVKGQKKDLAMLVSSTIYFDIAFSSSNQGNLGLVGGSQRAPYVFRLNDSVVDLSSGWTVALQNETPTTSGERSYRIEVEIGNVDGLAKGTYKDSIVVNVISR